MMAAVSVASADGGHIFVGVETISSDFDFDTVIVVDHPVGDNVTIVAAYWPSDAVYGVRARFGQDKGFYASATVWDGGVDTWRIGGYFEGALSAQFSYRVNLGIFAFAGFSRVWPDAAVDYEYELSDALAIMGVVSNDLARVGLGYHF